MQKRGHLPIELTLGSESFLGAVRRTVFGFRPSVAGFPSGERSIVRADAATSPRARTLSNQMDAVSLPRYNRVHLGSTSQDDQCSRFTLVVRVLRHLRSKWVRACFAVVLSALHYP
jgi:hypothetical protein